ncbi:MAG TPA: SIP domain-containing protein [Actinomycetospora sp.]|jgi:hypothetical protein|uniref:SIP domain-containing protein n=1 Tax=Actinomycetospora sp. TaxID=1872135 RepID=UPI002F400457
MDAVSGTGAGRAGEQDHEVIDLLGVGFGPSNLALAIAIATRAPVRTVRVAPSLPEASRSTTSRSPAGCPRSRAVVEVAEVGEEEELVSSADLDVRCLHRDGVPAGESTLLAEALAVFEFEFPTARGFVWVAGEAACVKPIRRMLPNHAALDAR